MRFEIVVKLEDGCNYNLWVSKTDLINEVCSGEDLNRVWNQNDRSCTILYECSSIEELTHDTVEVGKLLANYDLKETLISLKRLVDDAHEKKVIFEMKKLLKESKKELTLSLNVE